jgi:hypothetical protein
MDLCWSLGAKKTWTTISRKIRFIWLFLLLLSHLLKILSLLVFLPFHSSAHPNILLSQPKQNHLSTPIVEYSNLTAILIDIHDGILFGPSPPKPAPKSKTYRGSCHCGDITWTAKLEKAEHVLCHCDTCKKLGGGPYSLNAIIEGVSFPVFLISLNIFW